jgi:Fe2+ or Zn2+ uptake regulation protein
MVMGEEELIRQLKKIGIRLTPQRQEIIMLLLKRAEAGGPPLSADEIMQHVRMRYPSISLDTVYRSLATFTTEGLVRELQFREHSRRFELIYEDDHHYHFVCLDCGDIIKLPYCPVDCLQRTKECYPEYKIEDHSFTLYGYCPECKDD